MSADRRALFEARDAAAKRVDAANTRVEAAKVDFLQAQGDLLRAEVALRDASPPLAASMPDRCGKLLLGAWYCRATDTESETPCDHATYDGRPVYADGEHLREVGA